MHRAGTTRWLGIWLDSTPNLAEIRRHRIGKARQARSRALPHRQQVRAPPGGSKEPPESDRPGNHALRIGDHLERRKGSRKTAVTSWPSTDGPGIAGRLQVRPTRHRRGRKRFRAHLGPLEPQTSEVREKALRQTRRQPGIQGDPETGRLSPHRTAQSGRCYRQGRDGREIRVERSTPPPRATHGGTKYRQLGSSG